MDKWFLLCAPGCTRRRLAQRSVFLERWDPRLDGSPEADVTTSNARKFGVSKLRLCFQ